MEQEYVVQDGRTDVQVIVQASDGTLGDQRQVEEPGRSSHIRDEVHHVPANQFPLSFESALSVMEFETILL